MISTRPLSCPIPMTCCGWRPAPFWRPTKDILPSSRKTPARPFSMATENRWTNTGPFWKKMDGLPEVKSDIPASAREALEHLLPPQTLNYRVVRRVAGLGNLGHVRLVALTETYGGKIAREAKALVPSSVYWANESEGPTEILYQAIMSHAVRAPDPFVQVRGRWIVRRLSPHCLRIELDELPKNRDECRLLFAMGWETANIHLGSRGAWRDWHSRSASLLHRTTRDQDRGASFAASTSTR